MSIVKPTKGANRQDASSHTGGKLHADGKYGTYVIYRGKTHWRERQEGGPPEDVYNSSCSDF